MKQASAFGSLSLAAGLTSFRMPKRLPAALKVVMPEQPFFQAL